MNIDYEALYQASYDYRVDFAERYYYPKKDQIHAAAAELIKGGEHGWKERWMQMQVTGLHNRHFSVVESIVSEFFLQKKEAEFDVSAIDPASLVDCSFATSQAAKRVDLILKHPATYHVRGAIKSLGGKWRPNESGWKMPNQDAFNEALVACEEYYIKRYNG